MAESHAETPDGVNAGESFGAGLLRQGEHIAPGSEPVQPDRGVHADALVTVTEQREQFIFRDGHGERLGEDGFRGLIDVGRDLEAPDRAFAVERVTADPVGEVGATVDAPGHADAHQTLVDHTQFLLTEGVAVRCEREGVHLALRELVQDEMATQVAIDGMTRFEEEAGRTVGIVGDRRDDREGLVGGAGREPDVLFHPAALDGLILMLVAPTGVGAFEEVHQAFAFLRLVAVVVHADHVAEGVKGDLLGITDAMGVDLEALAVWFAAQDGAFMWEEETATLLARDVRPFVADGPIDPAVRAEPQAMHVVAGIGDMCAETRRDDFLQVGDPVAIGVLQSPDVGDGGDVDPSVEVKHAGRDA